MHFLRTKLVLVFLRIISQVASLISWIVLRAQCRIENSKDSLYLLFMGDPQYHFMCEMDNVQCKAISKRCRNTFGLPANLDLPNNATQRMKEGNEVCIAMESRFANRVQREAMVQLINNMTYMPTSLVINGDLTQYGHLHELAEFKQGWMTKFPIDIHAGLGNHDIENNINDCAFNLCAHTMLDWFTSYSTNMSLQVDVKREVLSSFDVLFKGSFAYTNRFCSVTGKKCALNIQLNNALDYSVNFTSLFVSWQVESPMKFLQRELQLHVRLHLGTLYKDNEKLPVLINMHRCETLRSEKLKDVVEKWVYRNKLKNLTVNVAVMFAHMHQKHEIHVYCIHGQRVPFVYVGSVPNNRFSMLKIDEQGQGELTAYKAKDSLLNRGEILENLGSVKLWGPCVKYENHSFFDQATYERWMKLKMRGKN